MENNIHIAFEDKPVKPFAVYRDGHLDRAWLWKQRGRAVKHAMSFIAHQAASMALEFIDEFDKATQPKSPSDGL